MFVVDRIIITLSSVYRFIKSSDRNGVQGDKWRSVMTNDQYKQQEEIIITLTNPLSNIYHNFRLSKSG